MTKRFNSDDLVIVDRKGFPTGDYAERRKVHAYGRRHGVSYVIPMTPQGNIVENKRSLGSDYFKGFWVPFAGGHVEYKDINGDRRQMYLKAAAREWKEETGNIQPLEAFIQLNTGVPVNMSEVSGVSGLKNNEYIVPFLLLLNTNITELNPDTIEVESLTLNSLDKVIRDLVGEKFKCLPEDFRNSIADGIEKQYRKLTRREVA